MEHVRERYPVAWKRAASRLDIQEGEVEEWRACAAGMTIPFDAGLGIHPQDDFFLDREVWDLSRTPVDLFPLLLNYHPLVIYRFQVLKQPDVVLAMFLQGDRFTFEEKRANVEYYDPITTGDSSLSAIVQSIMAAEVGYHDRGARLLPPGALRRPARPPRQHRRRTARRLGRWRVAVARPRVRRPARPRRDRCRSTPGSPTSWRAVRFRLAWRGLDVAVTVTGDQLDLAVEPLDVTDVTDPLVEGGPGVVRAEALDVAVRGERHVVPPGSTVCIPLDGHGPRLSGGLAVRPRTGGVRTDGSKITAGVPDPSRHHDPAETGELPVVRLSDGPGTDPTS